MEAKLIRVLRGRGLLELLVTVAVASILGLFSFSKYSDYQQHARRADAMSALQLLAARQEQYFVSNYTFTNDLQVLGFGTGITASGYYAISVPVATTDDFQAVAVPLAGESQVHDADCQQFTIDARGFRSASPDPAGDCW